MTDDAQRAKTNAVLDRAFELLVAHDMHGFAMLWAPDGIMEFPFAGPGRPRRLDGRTAVIEYLDGYTDMLDLRAIPTQTRHQTLDPRTVIDNATFMKPHQFASGIEHVLVNGAITIAEGKHKGTQAGMVIRC